MNSVVKGLALTGAIIMVYYLLLVLGCMYLIDNEYLPRPLPQQPDTIVGITGDYPYSVILANDSVFQIPVNHTIHVRCGVKWAMEDNNVVTYGDFANVTELYWDGMWRGDTAC